MKKRDFLLPLATLTAAVTANQASASVAMNHTDKAGENTAIEKKPGDRPRFGLTCNRTVS